ncbi:MAG: hypothetical protein PHH00_03560 [Candidatus Nanoarchaeia archaeon]|nr:hypothetical protein [Candidatus Nanoarchaeia archaeon]
MARRIRKTETAVRGISPSLIGNGRFHSEGEVKPIIGTITRTILGPKSHLKMTAPSYTPSEVQEGQGETGQIAEMDAIHQAVSYLGGEKRTEYERFQRRNFWRSVRNIGLAALCVAGLGFWGYRTIDMSRQIKAKNAQIVELAQTKKDYEQRFDELAVLQKEVWDPIEAGMKNLEQKLGAETFFRSIENAIGGTKYFLSIPIRGEDNSKKLADLVQSADELSFDAKEISNIYQVRTFGVELYNQKYPGFGLLRVGTNGKDIVGQEVGPTEYLLRLGPGIEHTGFDVNNVDLNDPTSLTVYTSFKSKVVADYMDSLKGRTIGFEAVGITDEFGRPLAMFPSHFENYSNKFPRYKLGTIIEEGQPVGRLGYTGILNGLHTHEEGRVGIKIDSKTGEVTKWERFDDIYENKVRFVNDVIFDLDNIPADFRKSIARYWQSKN